jgi:hypothetical protein
VIYSVYDYDKAKYRYFEGIGGTPATGFFRKARMSPIQGAHVPESFAVQLPAGARPIGEGPMPKGYVAEDPSGLAAAPVPGEGSAGATGATGATGGVRWHVVGVVAIVAFIVGRRFGRSS